MVGSFVQQTADRWKPPRRRRRRRVISRTAGSAVMLMGCGAGAVVGPCPFAMRFDVIQFEKYALQANQTMLHTSIMYRA